MPKISETFGKADYNDAKELIVGIECEIESIKSWRVGGWKAFFNITEDGSLRNDGREFISQPMPITALLEGFKILHKDLIYHPQFDPFSERTSIHVHVNCQNLTTDQVRNIILMYALFEEFFFAQTLPSRRDNIHCVPLTETFLPAQYSADLVRLFERWQKYTALNIKPLNEHGTIEFRHMHGHDDPVLLESWLRCIEKLFQLGANEPLDVKALSRDNIARMFGIIFGHTANFQEMSRTRDMNMFHQLLDVKLSMVK